jgi:Helix-turn-helix domain
LARPSLAAAENRTMDMHAKSGPPAPDPGQDHSRPSGRGDLGLTERRLLSPEQVAAYLGLRSRFAVYRLVGSGQLAALRLANKLRVDLRDLEILIEKAKADGVRPSRRSGVGAAIALAVPLHLAPRERRRRPVTRQVTPPRGDA